MKLNEVLGKMTAKDYVNGVAINVILSLLVTAARRGDNTAEIPMESVSIGDRREAFNFMTAWARKNGLKFENLLDEKGREIWVFKW